MVDPSSSRLTMGATHEPTTNGSGFSTESVMAVCIMFCAAQILGWIKKTEDDHRRGERLAAYKLRSRWKKGDITPLLSIGVSETAQRRMSTLQGRGRPVIKPHRPIGDVVVQRLGDVFTLFSDEATPSQRRQAVRASAWWNHIVEAMYRAERDDARTEGMRDAYGHAERKVAQVTRVSQGKVHALCEEVRAIRKMDGEAANFPALQVSEYEAWMEHGRLPERYR